MKNPSSIITRDHLKLLIKENGVFNKVFSNQAFQDFLISCSINYRSRSLTPDILLWGFLNQVFDEDHSCRAAVASIIARLKASGKKTISSSTGAYCQARKKLPEKFFSGLARLIAQSLDDHVKHLKWKGFNVKLVDGSDLNLPSTGSNTKVFPRVKRSGGLNKCRILGIFSLAHGGLIEMEVGAFKGKGSGEVSLFRKLFHCFKKGDLVVADRLFCNYFEMASLKKRGCEFVFRKAGGMKSDFRKGERLGKDDHIIELKRPWQRLNSVASGLIISLPRRQKVREVRLNVKRKGFRPKEIYLITSLLDPESYSKSDLMDLFKERWNVEVDFRSLKTFLKMDTLRCKSPEMVRKEIWMHVLAYNHIRAIMVDGSLIHKVSPREISFKETLQLFKSFRPYMVIGTKKEREEYYLAILEGLLDRVKNRPGRIEPRLTRENKRKFRLLKISREEARKGYWKGGWAREKRKRELDAAA